MDDWEHKYMLHAKKTHLDVSCRLFSSTYHYRHSDILYVLCIQSILSQHLKLKFLYWCAVITSLQERYEIKLSTRKKMQLLCIFFSAKVMVSCPPNTQKHIKTQVQIHMKKHQFPSEQLFLFLESIWWQHTQHLAPPLFFLLFDRKSLLHSSGHQSPDSVNKSIYSQSP